MFICIYVHIYIYIYVYVYVYLKIDIHTYLFMCAYILIDMNNCIYIYIYSVHHGYSFIRGSLLGQSNFTKKYEYASLVHPRDIDDIIAIHPNTGSLCIVSRYILG